MDKKYKDIGDPKILLIEECAELIQMLCKISRFGWKNWHPLDKKKTPNYELLKSEIKDVETRIKQIRRLIRVAEQS